MPFAEARHLVVDLAGAAPRGALRRPLRSPSRRLGTSLLTRLGRPRYAGKARILVKKTIWRPTEAPQAPLGLGFKSFAISRASSQLIPQCCGRCVVLHTNSNTRQRHCKGIPLGVIHWIELASEGGWLPANAAGFEFRV